MKPRTYQEREKRRAKARAYVLANYWALREKRQYYYATHRQLLNARGEYQRAYGCRWGATYPRLHKYKGKRGKRRLTLSHAAAAVTIDSLADAEELIGLYRRFRKCAISVYPYFVLPPRLRAISCPWGLCAVGDERSKPTTKAEARELLAQGLTRLYMREGCVEEHPHTDKEAGYMLLLTDEYEALPD